MSELRVRARCRTASSNCSSQLGRPRRTDRPDDEFSGSSASSWRRCRACAPSRCRSAGKHDKADDLVQDTVMKAWAKQTSFEMGTNIKAWLFTILRNEFYSQMRKRGREVQDTDGAFTERLSVHPASTASWISPTSRRRSSAAGRSARGGHPDRRLRLLLRGSRRDLQVRRRHDEEPRQPGPHPPAGNAQGHRRSRLRSGRHRHPGHGLGGRLTSNQSVCPDRPAASATAAMRSSPAYGLPISDTSGKARRISSLSV